MKVFLAITFVVLASINLALPRPTRSEEWIQEEFLSIERETSTMADSVMGLRGDNIYKNRYENVLPNERTRVTLKRKGSDYINANFIEGNGGERYIATQAPLPPTFEDFWLMVYQQKTRVIAMLTKLHENGMIKAETYWPEKSARWVNYGDLSVMLEKEQRVSDELTIRFFRIKHKEKGERSSAIQIHYTGWPDFGTPDNTDTFHMLLDLLDKYNEEDSSAGPMVVHCSAGLGRTGTLIGAHMARGMKAAQNKRDISVKDIVKSMREDRAGMVQSFSQYKFLVQIVKEM